MQSSTNVAIFRWRAILAAGLTVLGLAATMFLVRGPVMPPARGTTASTIPAPAVDEPATGRPKAETAVLAGGCFWGVQGVYQHVKGVNAAESGYAGGDAATANYEAVTTETTGHAESVRITYDPSQVSYGRLLQIFFAVVPRAGGITGPRTRNIVAARPSTVSPAARIARQRKITTFAFDCMPVILSPETVGASPAWRPFAAPATAPKPIPLPPASSLSSGGER